jgi:RimJ/RimL family protein N-acetyltransferase
MPAIPLPDPPLTDGVVTLRAPQAHDADALVAACQDELIQRYTFVPVPYERHHATGWIEDAPDRRSHGDALNLVIAAAATGELLGTTGILRPDWENRVADIGYFVAPWARAHGHAARAIALLAPWALRSLNLARVVADVDIDNVASQRAAERAGFKREGVLRSAIEKKGRRWTLVVYSLITEDLA